MNGSPASIRLFIMRHGRSFSNMLRDPRRLGRSPTKREVDESQALLDPPLTDFGQQACEWYRSELPSLLRSIGVSPARAVLGSSRLLRAQQTAEDIFPSKDLVIFKSLGENGDVPENTPRGMQYRHPSFQDFLSEIRQISLDEGVLDFVVVAHGSFIQRSISEIVGGEIPPLSNLDGYLLNFAVNKYGGLHATGPVISLPFPQKKYEEKTSDNESFQGGLPFPSVLRGWSFLMQGKHWPLKPIGS